MIKKGDLNGIIFSIVIGTLAIIIAYYVTFLNSLLLGLLLGIAVGNLSKVPKSFSSGISVTSSLLLEVSIVFLAFGINYTDLVKVGWLNVVLIMLTMLFVLILTKYLSRKLNCPSNVGYMVGFGTAICGSSAIAALAPTFKENKEDIGVSMAVVNLYGVIGMLTLPLFLPNLGFTPIEISLIIGGTLHAVGNVVGAGYAISEPVGDVALTVKLARVALLSPALIFFNFFINKQTDWKKHFKLPWYLWVFIIISAITSYFTFPKEFLSAMSFIGKVTLTIAMVAIGLKVGIKTLLTSAKKGLLFGGIIFFFQLLFLIGLLLLLR